MSFLKSALLGSRASIFCGVSMLAVVASLAAGSHAFAAGKGLLVVFMPPGTDNYLAQWQKGARAKAQELGYDIKIIETTRDQAEQDSQVQQQLASGDKVAGYIWWPYVNAAGTGSLRALSQTGVPVVFTNQYPIAGTEKFWTAYAGVNDFLNAETAAKALLKACAETLTAKCDKGLIITFPAGYSAGSDRVKAFKTVVDGKLTVILEQEGYMTASQIIPAHKNEISWVYTENDSLAEGVIQALKENGLHPGKDVLVVGGTCHGDTKNLLNKEIIGTGIQAAFLEGWSSVQSTHKYLQSKKVADGETYLPGDANTAPSDDGEAHRFNFIPNPWVGNTQADLDNFKLWGHTFKELCNY
jgi:ABC-type sugar transport system substrate-binding protein